MFLVGEDMTNKEKVVVAFCESRIQRDLIKEALCGTKGFCLIVSNNEELIGSVLLNGADVLIVDYNYINNEQLRALCGNSLTGDLIMYNFLEEIQESQVIQWPNLKGLLYNTAPVEHFSKCLEHVLNGDMWLPRKIMVAMLQCSYEEPKTNHSARLLTRRERQILDLLANGKSNQAIADNLYITESTVKTHVYRLYKKINVRCRKEAISYVYKKSHIPHYKSVLIEDATISGDY